MKTDKSGVQFSDDGKTLIKCPVNFEGMYNVPNGVTSIGSEAFKGCKGLKTITIPDSVTSIGQYAFYNCISLTSPIYSKHLFAYMPNSYSGAYTIPDGIKTIAEYALADCRELVEVNLGKGVKTIGAYAFYHCYALENIQLPEGLTEIGEHAFYDTSIKNIVIPSSVTEIDNQAFRSCSQLTSIHIPDSVVRIGEWAFDGCDNLKTIHIGSGVQTIGEAAFSTVEVETITVDSTNPYYDSRDNCNAIIETKTNTLIAGCNSTKIPDDIEHIARGAFYGCKAIEHIELPYGVKTIGVSAFDDCTTLATITIPDSLTEIGAEAFLNCEKLQSITIPNGVQKIWKRAFKLCNSLTSITLPKSVQSIGEEAFCHCASLQSITIAEGITCISHHAFEDCKKLMSIVIPASIKEVGWYAFNECTSLSSVSFCGQIEKMGKIAFAKCSYLAKIIVPKGTKEQYVRLFQDAEMPSLSKKIREGGPVAYSAATIQEDGDLIFEDDANTILHACKPTVTTIVVPETVKKINPDAFAECKELTSVTIGIGAKSVKTITKKLFRNCKNLTTVVLGDSVTAIGVEAFAVDGWHDTGNPNLQSITIPASVKKIGFHAFYSCDKLTEVHIADLVAWCNMEFDGEHANPFGFDYRFPKHVHHLFLGNQEIHDLIIPEGVTRIQKALFAGCSDFTSVTIPNTVTAIDADAFFGCTGVNMARIPDSVSQIGKNAFDGINNLIYSGPAKWEEDNLWWGAKCLNGFVENNFIYDSESKTVLCGCLKADIGDVVIPNSVTKIGDRAFQGCSGLTSIVIPNGVKEIGKSAFEGCSALKFITIPEGVKEIAYSTFSGCMNLSSVTIPDSVKCLRDSAFKDCENLQQVRIPEGVDGIECWTFAGCVRLKDITIPKSVQYIDNWAFHTCEGLETIIFQGPVQLGYWCIVKCNNLKHVIIPQGTKDHFLKQNEGTDLGIKNFADILEEEGSNVAEQQQEVITLLTMAQGFDKGIGVPKNGEMAISLYKQAAEKGSPEAAYRLGVCYRDGEYVPQDKDAALTYFRQAAESKYKDSEEQVAKLQQ